MVEESTLSHAEKKITFPTFVVANDSEKATFLDTSSSLPRWVEESNLTPEQIALLERIRGRLEAMDSEVTPYKLAVGMRGNDQDIGIARCKAWLEAGA